MAYIKERGNNNYFVRVSYGMLENGRPFQKSRLFHPSKLNLPASKIRKELDSFVKALEEECRLEFEYLLFRLPVRMNQLFPLLHTRPLHNGIQGLRLPTDGELQHQETFRTVWQ